METQQETPSTVEETPSTVEETEDNEVKEQVEEAKQTNPDITVEAIQSKMYELLQTIEASDKSGRVDGISGIEFTFAFVLLYTAVRKNAFNAIETQAATAIVNRWYNVYRSAAQREQTSAPPEGGTEEQKSEPAPTNEPTTDLSTPEPVKDKTE